MFATFVRAGLLGCLLAGPAAHAVAKPLASFTANYTVLRDGSELGRADLVYQRQGSQGDFSTHIEGTAGLAALAGADIREHSVLDWGGDVPETIRYDYRMKLAWKQRERSVQVDARAGTIASFDKGRRYDFPYEKGVLDRHAVTVALMQALAAGQRDELAFRVADRGKLEHQRYSIGQQETLETARGKRPALRVERIRDSADGKSTTIWFDRERGFIPLQIVQTEADGERLELRISR